MLGPIFAREWLTVPRRPRHYALRTAYLSALWVLGLTTWQVTVGWNETATLGDNARFGLLLLQVCAVTELVLVLFFSALSAASAVSQEKDRRTFVLLLMTDLRSYEIVLGKLFGSLLQIALLLMGVIPFLALLMLLGGVAPWQVAQVAMVLVGTALAAGSIGTLIALWREKTFQALALTVLFIVLYLFLVQAAGAILSIFIPANANGLHVDQMATHHWQAWIDPFAALQSVLELSDYEKSRLPPAIGYSGIMLALSFVLNAISVARLRKWNPSGEPIVQREMVDEGPEKDRAKAHAAPGAVRSVWANPILWREIRTRAYGKMPLLVKAAYGIVLILVCYYAMAPLWFSASRAEFAAARGLVPVGILSLLLISLQAVTAITSERDGGALSLLLATDLTPKEFIFGKLLGVFYNTKEYFAPPIILAAVYSGLGLLATPPARHPELLGYKNVEALVCVSAGTVIVLGFANVLGIHVALRTENSRLAIINTLATIFFLSAGTLVCIFLIRINFHFEYQVTSFLLFIVAGIGGLWWVLNVDRPSGALTLASWCCPPAMFYTVTNVLVARPGSQESTDPLLPFLVISAAFGFTIAAMLVPLLSEFDVALGRTTGGGE